MQGALLAGPPSRAGAQAPRPAGWAPPPCPSAQAAASGLGPTHTRRRGCSRAPDTPQPAPRRPGPALPKHAPAARPQLAPSRPGTRCAASTLEREAVAGPTGGGDLSRLPEPQGDWSLPVVGETEEHLRDHYAWAFKRVQKYGPVFKSTLYGREYTIVTDFEGLFKVFGGEHKVTKFLVVPSLERLLGTTAESKEKGTHARMRRQQGAAFTPAAMDSYLPRVEETCRGHLEAWVAAGEVDLLTAVARLAFDFGEGLVVGPGLIRPEEREAMRLKWDEFTSNAFTYLLDLPGTPYRKSRLARDYLLAKLLPAVRALKAEILRLGPGAPKDTLLQHYMAARLLESDELQEEQLAMDVIGLMLAGNDTSKLSHKVLLGIYPDLPPRVRSELLEEQRRVVAEHGPELTPRAFKAMRYADAVAREVLRIWGPAGILFRDVIADFELHGKLIKKGTTILVSPLYAKACDARVSEGDHTRVARPRHMDIQDLEASFRPERWLQPGLDNSALGTFGHGAHFCLGFPLYMMEAKVLLALLAREFRVENASGPIDWGAAPGASGGSPVGDVTLRFAHANNL